jgi:hypothetical protein
MTLLLGARGRSHILITADGQRSVGTGAAATVADTNLQKVFPADYRPLAVAHHGQNLIDGQPVHELIPAFLNENRAGFAECSVRQICAQLILDFDNAVTETLRRIDDSVQFAVWIAAIEPAFSRPSIYEISWRKEGYVDNGMDILMSVARLGDIVLGGDGKEYILEYLDQALSPEISPQHVYFQPLPYSKAVQDELYSLALQRQAERQEHRFGGHKHQLAITRGGCDWLIAPLL